MKVCVAFSGGGHAEQASKLVPLLNVDNVVVVMKKLPTNNGRLSEYKTYCIGNVESFIGKASLRKKIRLFLYALNFIESFVIYLKERPSVIITTGAGPVVPLCLISKLFGGKVVWIESFARINSASRSGKFIYRFADLFLVQWEEMLDLYPDAKYYGKIY